MNSDLNYVLLALGVSIVFYRPLRARSFEK